MPDFQIRLKQPEWQILQIDNQRRAKRDDVMRKQQ